MGLKLPKKEKTFDIIKCLYCEPAKEFKITLKTISYEQNYKDIQRFSDHLKNHQDETFE